MPWLLAVLLQSPVPPPPASPDPPAISLERIRRGLQEEVLPFDSPATVRPVFRVVIRERMTPVSVLWQDSTLRPAHVRTRQPITHYEFLLKVTPENFRAATLHPVGISVFPAVTFLKDRVARAVRSRAERRAKEQVERELLALRSPPK